MAFPNVELHCLTRGGTAQDLDLNTVPSHEMELTGGRLTEKVPSGCLARCTSSSSRKATLDTKRFFKAQVQAAVSEALFAQLALARSAEVDIDFQDDRTPLTNHDVIKVKLRCLQIRERYDEVSACVKQARDWYVFNHLLTETPPRMPRLFCPPSISKFTVVGGSGASTTFDEEILRTYLDEVHLSRALNPSEVDDIVKAVKKAAMDSRGMRISSRQLSFFTIERLHSAGVAVLQPPWLTRLNESERRLVGSRGHLYQLGPDMFWRLLNAIYA